MFKSSGQDRGLGGNASLPHTIKRRITANIKTINNQNCQKIKLHESPTKELREHTSRPVRGAETGSGTDRTRGKVAVLVSEAGTR